MVTWSGLWFVKIFAVSRTFRKHFCCSLRAARRWEMCGTCRELQLIKSKLQQIKKEAVESIRAWNEVSIDNRCFLCYCVCIYATLVSTPTHADIQRRFSIWLFSDLFRNIHAKFALTWVEATNSSFKTHAKLSRHFRFHFHKWRKF